MHFTTKVHRNLLATSRGPAVRTTARPTPIHLRQSELDEACGQHCVFMALLTLRIASRAWLMGTGAKGAGGRGLNSVWRDASSHFMGGSTARDLAQLLKPLKSIVSTKVCSASHSALISFALEALSRDDLVIVGVANGKRALAHWLLAVGMAGLENPAGFLPSHLLLLDPNEDPVPLMQWNATLETQPGRARGKARALTNRRGEKLDVTLHEGLAIGRRSTRRRAAPLDIDLRWSNREWLKKTR